MEEPATMHGAVCDWAHRINTPLTSIVLDLERVVADHACLERLHRNLDELRRVLADLAEAERGTEARRDEMDEALVAPTR